jgi:hypothetical protein
VLDSPADARPEPTLLGDASAFRPQPLGDVLRAMLTTRSHAGPALLLVWGVVTGVLGVGVTILKQL